MQRVRGSLYSLLTLAALGAVVSVPAPLSAQANRPAAATAGPRPIRFGQDVTGSLTDADPALTGRGPFHAYRFTAKAEKRYIITLDAPDFDALVMVMREVGGITDVVASDDDGGGGMNARLRFRPPAAGSYIIVAQSLPEDGRGAYTLRITEMDPPPPPQPRPLAVGQNLQGSITNESAVDDDEGFPFDVYRIRGNGERVRIVMRSEDFDTFLALKKVTASGEEEVASDDDGGGGTDSRLTLVLDGEYRLYARPLANVDRGAYSLTVEEAAAVQVTQRPIKIGDAVEGELSDTDPELDEGGFFHEYVIDAKAGDNLRITLRSEEFDSYLRWGTKAGTTFTELASDDDSGGDLDSQLVVQVDAAGRFVIRVAALGSGDVGPYRLSVERVTP